MPGQQTLLNLTWSAALISEDDVNVPGITVITEDEDRTTWSLLRARAESAPDRVYVTTRSREETTYRALLSRVESARETLTALGVRPGDHVAVMLPNDVEILVLWFALNSLGAAPAMVNTAYRGDLLAHVLLETSGAQVLITSGELVGHFKALRGRLSRYRQVIALPRSSAGSLKALADTVPERGPAPQVDISFDDLSVIVPTSGTTGPTKGVMLSHSHALHYAEITNAMRRIGRDDVYYTHTPLFHTDGLFGNALAAMVAGAKLLLIDRFSVSRFWSDVLEHDVTTFAYAGGMISMLYHSAPPPPGIEHRLHSAYGAPSPPHLARQFEELFGVRLLEGYGSTEAGILTMCPWNDSRIEEASMGLPTTGYQVAILDEHGRALGVDKVGEIAGRPEHPSIMMMGYYARPDLTLHVWRNLWFHSGDWGRIDSDGHLFFLGRMSDTIRRRGENISCLEIETAADHFEGVIEAAAFGVPSEMGEEEVMIAVKVEPSVDRETFYEGLSAFINERLASFMAPRYIEIVEDFERSAATHKIQKRPLVERGVTSATWDRITAGTATKSGS